VKRLRDFDSINAFFSDREIDDLQAAGDARREARALGPSGSATPVPPSKKKPRPGRPAKTPRAPDRG
jgi:hypothetical protein